MGTKFDIITHHFMLEFVDSDLYFVQDKNNYINPLLQVGFGSGSVEKSTGSGSGGPKITGSNRIRILIPAFRAGRLLVYSSKNEMNLVLSFRIEECP